jgi:hypothetical protein
MLLPIYSLANLNVVSWGTREDPSPGVVVSSLFKFPLYIPICIISHRRNGEKKKYFCGGQWQGNGNSGNGHEKIYLITVEDRWRSVGWMRQFLSAGLLCSS